ncbi:DUF3015 family protein [Leptospira sp. 96542]|nr:DUF3015 family protein [Leptospira sp. 96542]
MKFKIFLIFPFSLVLIFSVQLIAEPYGMAGCGLGSMVPAWKNDIGQVLAATTNTSTSSQTFGITSGTSNCTTDGIVKEEQAQEVFVTYNRESLELDMAKGSGERINAMANLFGCPSHNKELGALVQNHYSELVLSDDKKDAKLLLSKMKKKIASDEILRTVCTH